MSEFVECQNCGRRYFAENLECPYCSGTQDVDDLIAEVSGRTRDKRLVFQRMPLVILILVAALLLLFVIPALRSMR